MSDDNYIEAMRIVVDQSKSTVTISAAPLALLLTQARYLLAIDSVWVSIVVTVAALSLFCATSLSWYLAQFAQATLASEVYHKNGEAPAKGGKYMDFIHKLSGREDFLYTEENFIALSEKIVWPNVWALAVGYVSLLVMLLLVIWMAPTP